MPASAVDYAAQRGKKLRHTVDLVKHDEAILEFVEKLCWIGKLGPIFAGFEVN